MASENSSIKSAQSGSNKVTATTPSSRTGSVRKVGFSRPTLIIPPSNVHYVTPNPYSAKLTMTATPEMYGKKASKFVFDQFQGMVSSAKSGLGFGEKCAYWLYNKLKSWSKKWFTHFFLTIVLVLYTVGGALSFIALEGPYEDLVYELDIRTNRYELIEQLTNLTKHLNTENKTDQWMKEAEVLTHDFLSKVIDNHKNKVFIEANIGNKVWSMWNAIVFCATIFTTIGTNQSLQKPNGCTTPTNSNETPQPTEAKRESITDIAQAELVSLFHRTKKSITNAAVRGRDKFRKSNYKELVNRSKSAPNHNHENSFEAELIASFNKAQLLQQEKITVRSAYSNTSLRHSPDDDDDDGDICDDGYEPKPLRPEVQEFVRQRKSRSHSIKQFGVVSPTPKIVEILDPNTSDVIATKAYVKEDFKIKEFLKLLRMFSVLEIYRQFKEFKRDMNAEFVVIRKLWNRCLCDLFLVVVYCGMGGLIFKFTEGRFENYYKCGVKKIRRDFIDLLWIKSHNLREDDWKSLARTRLRMFEDELHVAHEAGMTSYSGQRSWGFLNGIVYALTIVTTIGYGHMCPKTLEGRILTIVYALIGIPLFLIALTDFGKLFTRCIKFLWSFVRRLYYTGSCRNVRKTAQVQEIFKGAQMMYEIATFRRPSTFIDPENPQQIPTIHTPGGTITTEGTPTTPAISVFEIDDEFNLPISVALFILVAYIFCGAVMYMMIENWRFFESFYFVFISMSTIGFGDYVPRHPVFMIASIVYLVFGLALMSMCINVVQAKLSETFKQASAKIGATMGLQVDDDGSIITVPPEHVEIAEVHLDANKLSPHTPNSIDVKLKDFKDYLNVKEKES